METYVVVDTKQGRMYLVRTDNYVRAKRLVYDAQIALMGNEERKRRGLMQVSLDNYYCLQLDLTEDRVAEVHPIWLDML